MSSTRNIAGTSNRRVRSVCPACGKEFASLTQHQQFSAPGSRCNRLHIHPHLSLTLRTRSSVAGAPGGSVEDGAAAMEHGSNNLGNTQDNDQADRASIVMGEDDEGGLPDDEGMGNNGNSDDDDDDDVGGGDIEEMQQWEPPRVPRPQHHAPVNPRHAPVHEEPELAQQQLRRRVAQGRTIFAPKVTVPFPSRRAGAPVPSRDVNNNPQTGFQSYQNSLHNIDAGESSARWAPFQSEMDWQIAQWAKLRGPGSTALDELLRIDGVSPFPHVDMSPH